jgi:hypothetical protein
LFSSLLLLGNLFFADEVDVCCAGINSGDTGGWYWFGMVFSGDPTTDADYVRENRAHGSIAFTKVDPLKIRPLSPAQGTPKSLQDQNYALQQYRLQML